MKNILAIVIEYIREYFFLKLQLIVTIISLIGIVGTGIYSQYLISKYGVLSAFSFDIETSRAILSDNNYLGGIALGINIALIIVNLWLAFKSRQLYKVNGEFNLDFIESESDAQIIGLITLAINFILVWVLLTILFQSLLIALIIVSIYYFVAVYS